MSVLAHAMGYPQETEEHAAAVLAGGIANQGYQCGMLWGASPAAGAQAYRLFGPGPAAEAAAVAASQRILEAFRGCNRAGETDCIAITGLNLREKVRIGQILRSLFTGRISGCFTMCPGVARSSLAETDAALALPPADVPASPVSCAALFARQAGLTEEQIVMAAGLAGGIGLSGSGCGALGAALWAYSLKRDAGQKTIGPESKMVLDRFTQRFGPDLRCATIAGQKFESVRDHADFIRTGGCSEVIGSLSREK